MIRNPNMIDRLYLSQGNEDIIYIDHAKIPQNTINGIRFLYKQFKRRRNGVILNDPYNFGRNVQICLFLKAVRPLLHRPVLILCEELNVKDWVARFNTWTDEKLFNEVIIETVNPHIKKMVMINPMVNLHLFCAREWSIIIVEGDNVKSPNPILKLPFRACFKIWNTSVHMKRNLSRFEEVYKWLFPREIFEKHNFIPDHKDPRDIVEKSIMLDSFFEDIVLRRNDKSSSIESHQLAPYKQPQHTVTTNSSHTATSEHVTKQPAFRTVGNTTIRPTGASAKAGSYIVGNTIVTPRTVAPSTSDCVFNVGDTTFTASTADCVFNIGHTTVTPTADCVFNVGDTTVSASTADCVFNVGDTTVTPTADCVFNVGDTTFTPSTAGCVFNMGDMTVAPKSVDCIFTVGDTTITPPAVTVAHTPTPVPTVTISKKNKDATGTKIKRSKTRIDSETLNKPFESAVPMAVLTKLLAEQPKCKDDEGFDVAVDFCCENYKIENRKRNGQQSSTDISEVNTEKKIKLIGIDEEPGATAQISGNKLLEYDELMLGKDTSICMVDDDISAKGITASDRKGIEPHTILTCKPVGEPCTHNSLFTVNRNSTSTVTSQTSSSCSDTERDEKNDRKILKFKSKVSTNKQDVDIIEVNLDELNREMRELDTKDKPEHLAKRQKTAHSSETATCEIIKKFDEKNTQTSVSGTKGNTEQVANSLKRLNLDVKMKECEETVSKKFKGSLLDSLF